MTANKLRQYESIWLAIRNAPTGTVTAVKIHATASKTLRQAVFKEKSLETSQRKKLGMRFAGKLEVTEQLEGVVPHGYVILNFKLSWDGTKL